MIGFGTDTERAPVLDYSLPRSTEYTFYGTLPFPVDRNRFKPITEPPELEESVEEIVNEIVTALQGNMGSRYIQATAAELRQIEFVQVYGSTVVYYRADNDFKPDYTLTAAAPGSTSAPSPPTFTNTPGGHPLQGLLGNGPQAFQLSTAPPPLDAIYYKTGIDLNRLALAIKKRAMAVYQKPERFVAGRKMPATIYLTLPRNQARQKLFLLEEYKLASWANNYGAGRVIKTESLLPNETLTVQIKTWQQSTINTSKSESIIENQSEEVVAEFNAMMEDENVYVTSTTLGMDWANEITKKGKVGGGLSFSIGPIISFEGGGGYEYEETNYISESLSFSREDTNREFRSLVGRYLSSKADSRVNEVSTVTNFDYTQGAENVTIRTLQNMNASRTLNFVFRELMQEYVTLQYLNDFSICFASGFGDPPIVVSIGQLDDLLNDVIADAPGENPDEWRDEIRKSLIKQYCEVYNFRNEKKQFLELHVENYSDSPCVGGSEPEDTIEYLRKYSGPPTDPGILDVYSSLIKVPGIILRVWRTVMPTTSIIVDALLGRGEALDCYNSRLQDATARAAELENQRRELALEVVEDQPTPAAQAEAYRKVYYEPVANPWPCTDNGTHPGHEWLALMAPTELSAAPGGTATANLLFSREHVTGTVFLNVQDLPGTITLAPAAVSSSENTAVLTFTVASTALPGTYPCQLMLFSEGHHKALPFTFTVTE